MIWMAVVRCLRVLNKVKNIKDERIYLIDNLRGILIFLVVFGHAITYYESPIKNYLYQFIYSFHMPAFAFVSGLCHPKKIQYKKLIMLMVQYISLQTVFLIFESIVQNKAIELQYHVPFWILWYIFALFWWRLVTGIVKIESNIAKVFLGLCIMGALIAGYIPFVEHVFELSRIICFYPFYLIGAIVRKTNFGLLLEINQIKWCYLPKITIMFMVLIVSQFLRYAHYGQETLFCSSPYVSMEWYAFFPRLSLYIIASIMIMFLVFYVPADKVPILTIMGSNTMAIYLFHAFLRIYLLESIGLDTGIKIAFFIVISCSVGYIANLKTMFPELKSLLYNHSNHS